MARGSLKWASIIAPCMRTGPIFDVPACPDGVESMAPDGFVTESHEVILYGRCPGCR